MAIFQMIIDLLRQFWNVIYICLPIKCLIVSQGESGVRFTFGRPNKNRIGTGIFFGTCGQTLYSYHTKLCTSGIDEIKTTLEDGTPICVDGVLTYTIHDLGKFLTGSEGSDWLISEYAEAVLRKTLAAKGFEDFHKKPTQLDTRIKNELQRMCDQSELGVTIEYYRIKTFEITDPNVKKAWAVDVLNKALNGLQHLPANARVALISGALPTNPLAEIVHADPKRNP
jgi:regulator of protease activity HflC (stomatin/prohibitin superfamily)